MKKKTIISLVLVLCLLISSSFILSSCSSNVSGFEWIKISNIAQRNWGLVDMAKDTYLPRTITSVVSEKEYNFEDDFWDEFITSTTVICSGYAENKKYYTKTVTQTITIDGTETNTREAFLGKTSDTSWVFCEYDYEGTTRPEISDSYELIATNKDDYLAFLANESYNNGARYKLFESSNSSYDVEEYISEKIVNIDSFFSFEYLLYSTIYDISIYKNSNEYIMELNYDELDGYDCKGVMKRVIKDNRISEMADNSSGYYEELNDEGVIEVDEKYASSKTLKIDYTGDVIVPVETPPI